MLKIETAIDQLNGQIRRYQSLKKFFNNFLKIIETARYEDFPVQGISVGTTSSTESHVIFLNRKYCISFSVAKDLGIINFARISGEATTQLYSAKFNGLGVMEVEPPEKEDPMNMKDDSCCLNLLLNWLLQDSPQ